MKIKLSLIFLFASSTILLAQLNPSDLTETRDVPIYTNGRIVENLTQYRNDSNSPWVNEFNDFFEYLSDSGNAKTSDIRQVWNGTMWVNQDRTLYTYNANNTLVTTRRYVWDEVAPLLPSGWRLISTIQAPEMPICQAGFTLRLDRATVVCTNTSSISGRPPEENQVFYSWNFGDNSDLRDSSSINFNEVHTYTVNGTYTVTLSMRGTHIANTSEYRRVVIITSIIPPNRDYNEYGDTARVQVIIDGNFVDINDISSINNNNTMPISREIRYSPTPYAPGVGNNSTRVKFNNGAYYAYVTIYRFKATGEKISSSDVRQKFIVGDSIPTCEASFTIDSQDSNTVSITNTSSGSGPGFCPPGTSVGWWPRLRLGVAERYPCQTTYSVDFGESSLPDSLPSPPALGNWMGTSLLLQASHTYRADGIYTITLLMRNSDGCTSEISDIITVPNYIQSRDSSRRKMAFVGAGGADNLNYVFDVHSYPNPFHKTTTIKYSLGESSEMSIVVYDRIGSKVVELENSNKIAGQYELEWNAENLPAGIYYLELTAGSHSERRKLILIK